MSGEQDGNDSTNFSRRTFMKASGAAAAGLLASNAAGTVASDVGPLDDRLLNWRVAEAKKVWDRGYRGRPDRTLGLTDSGISPRHPDLGPWNGLRIRPEGDGIQLSEVVKERKQVPVTEATTFKQLSFSSQNVGAGAVGLLDQTDAFDMEPQGDVYAHNIAATLSWNVDTPEAQAASVEATLQRQTENGFTDVASFGPDGLTLASSNEHELSVEVEPGETYRFEVTTWRGAAAWELDVELQTLQATDETELDTVIDFEQFDGTVLPDRGDVDGDGDLAPKSVAWYSETTRYGAFDLPRDRNGHGTHCSGIMTATGRASTIDHERTEVHEENTILAPSDFIEYEVTASAGTGVFASAIGKGIVVEIVHDSEVIDSSPLRFDSSITDEPTVHDSGEGTYTIRVKPAETEAVTDAAAEQATAGNPLVGQLDEIAVGAYKHPAETNGDRTGDETAVHSGVAPNFSLAGFQGLSGPAEDLGPLAEDVADTLNLRAVNMSWGPLLGAPVSALGALPSTAPAIRSMADAGILTIAAAGNSWTPANGNGEPAVVGEAISVVATDPFDGITGYSSGGIGSLNETQDGFDRKPDVTAPGGDIKPDAFATIIPSIGDQLTPVDLPSVGTPTPDNVELVRATLNPDPDADVTDSAEATVRDTDVPRDHRSIGGTSMASPYVCGTSGLVAQAMEEDAPESIALPEPGADDVEREDTMRLKQTILATASTTAFTAAPYHNAQLVPSPAAYTHGERDPYEGYGRVNPDAAVDAVTRDLFEGETVELGGGEVSASFEETVGLDVPFDSRAVAGYVQLPGGEFTASIEFDSYSGGNAGMAAGDPHLDLFIYDAENPTDVGDPNIVDSAMGEDGTAEVSATVDRGSREEPNEDTYFVVAKLVNVPGVVNGFDVQANFSLNLEFTAGEIPDVTTVFTASGSRGGDGSVFTGGQTNRVEITIEDFDHAKEIEVTDTIPTNWDVDTDFGDAESFNEDGDGVVTFGRTISADEVGNNGSVTLAYFAEAPQGATETDRYDLGEAEAEVVTPDVPGEDTDDELDGDETDTFAGTDTVVVAGASTNV